MFEDLFLIVYGLTVLFFFIGYTGSVLKGRWNKRIQTAAESVVAKVEQESGFRFNTKAMANFIEFGTVIAFLLPLVNTCVMVKSISNSRKAKKAFNAATKRIVDEHTKFLDD